MKKIKLLTLLMAAPMLWSCSADDPMPPQTETAAVEDPNFIPLDEAIKNADKHFADFFGDNTRSGRKVENVEFLGMRTRSDSNDDVHGFYVVNYENNGGFALLSADRRRESVYAIAEEGTLHLSDTLSNNGLGWYINTILEGPDGIAAINPGIIPPIKPPVNPIDTGRYEPVFPSEKTFVTTIAVPMLKGFYSRFHQENPYNKYCPLKNEMRTMVGCVPLAVGTIIGYNEWPNVIDGYSLPWNDMRVKMYSDGWCRLFEILGRKAYLNVKYGNQQTDGSAYYVEPTFKKLGYVGLKNSDFNEGYIDSELKNGMPVLAYSTAGGQHIWIIDGAKEKTTITTYPYDPNYIGYKETKYYHCVWGENGWANGYFIYDSNESLGGTPVEYDGDSFGDMPVYKNIDIFYGYRPNR